MSVTSVRIPKAGQAIDEGTVARWLVRDREAVEVGQSVYLLETDKVEMEIESPATGTINILVPEGTTLAVGSEVARIDG